MSTFGVGANPYNLPCTCHPNLREIDKNCPEHGWGLTPPFNASIVYQTCVTCGASLISLPCPNCGCEACSGTGNMEVLIAHKGPMHRGTIMKPETTWCPHCEEGQVWRELLDG